MPKIPTMDQEDIVGFRSPETAIKEQCENAQLATVGTLPSAKQKDTPSTQFNIEDGDCLSKGVPFPEHLDAASALQDPSGIRDSPQLSSCFVQDERQAIPSQVLPDVDETDLEGHYVGPSSGVSFLLRVQKRLHENLKLSSSELIFNFGDAPFPTYDPHFLVLPPIHEALALVNRYFEFSFPTHRFLHQATVEEWVHVFYSGIHGTNGTVSRAIKAVILMVMAQGRQYCSGMEATAGQSVNR